MIALLWGSKQQFGRLISHYLPHNLHRIQVSKIFINLHITSPCCILGKITQPVSCWAVDGHTDNDNILLCHIFKVSIFWLVHHVSEGQHFLTCLSCFRRSIFSDLYIMFQKVNIFWLVHYVSEGQHCLTCPSCFRRATFSDLSIMFQKVNIFWLVHHVSDHQWEGHHSSLGTYTRTRRGWLKFRRGGGSTKTQAGAQQVQVPWLHPQGGGEHSVPACTPGGWCILLPGLWSQSQIQKDFHVAGVGVGNTICFLYNFFSSNHYI